MLRNGSKEIVCCLEERGDLLCTFCTPLEGLFCTPLGEREERDSECWRGRRRGEENLEDRVFKTSINKKKIKKLF